MSKTNKSELNTSEFKESLWLVKVPKVLYDSWTDPNRKDFDLGSMTMEKSMAKVILKQPENSKNEIGKHSFISEFKIEELSSSLLLVPFKHDDTLKSFSVKGKITKQSALKPLETENYRNLLRSRTVQAAHKDRSSKGLDHSFVNIGLPVSHEMDFIPPAYVESKRKGGDSKSSNSLKKSRPNMDVKELRASMFQAFEKKEKLTFKEVLSFCQTASGKDLKLLLKDYAIFHAKGIYRNYWELKPEYRSQSGTVGAASNGVAANSGTELTEPNTTGGNGEVVDEDEDEDRDD